MEAIMSKGEIGKVEKKGARVAKGNASAVKALNTAFKDIANRGVNIGNGFYLIEIKGNTAAPVERKRPQVPMQPQKLPGIKPVPNEEIEHILRLFLRPSAEPKGTTTKRTRRAKGIVHNLTPEANTAFLTQFARNENASIMRLAEAGVLVNTQRLAERLGVTHQAIYKAVRDLRMFSLNAGGRTKLYPAFFADHGLERTQLETICKELDRLPGTSKWQFFTTPRLSLSKRNPLDALRKGKFEDVMAAARAFKEA